ncbi:MAG: hypothetical protein ACE5I3_13090 [Phycisphaerae bacterium]
MKPAAPPPRPRFRWVITCTILFVLFTAAHLIAVAATLTGSPFGSCGLGGAPLFAILWAGMFVSYKKRNRDQTGNCAHCGWKLRPPGSRMCFICGAYQRGFCPECGYDLTGNVSGRCPECGEEISPRGK